LPIKPDLLTDPIFRQSSLRVCESQNLRFQRWQRAFLHTVFGFSIPQIKVWLKPSGATGAEKNPPHFWAVAG